MNRSVIELARKGLALGLALGLTGTMPGTLAMAQQPVAQNVAQQASIAPVRPDAPILLRPYLPAEVPPVRTGNSGRFATLIRAGKLYLSVRDAIALTLENNIDIEVARYGPYTLEWRLERAQAGGALPGVPSGASQAASVASGQGVQGSQVAAGLGNISSSNNNRGTANATVTQVGPVTANLDPAISEASTFSHRTVPQPNVTQSLTPILVQAQRVYTGSYQQGYLFGGGVNASYNDHYLSENAPTDILNPSSSSALSVSIQQNLLQGLGVAVNARTINVAKINLSMSDLNFKAQVSTVVVNVLNAYYALTADFDDQKSKQDAVDTAQRFYDDSVKRLDLGALAMLDVTTARNQVATAKQNLVNSQAEMQQDELQLKNLISRNGLGDPSIADVRIIPLDRISVPPSDDLPAIPELARKALANRPELIVEQENARAAAISALGTINGLLPSAQVFTTITDSGLAGTPHIVNGRTAPASLKGGPGTAFGQIMRRDFPSESIGVFGSIQIYDRQAQADYAIDQLQIRQQQLTTAKDLNQAQVDVTNAVVALRQARARYDAAVQNRILDQQLLDAEQKKFALGASTSYNVVQQQRDLSAAQSSEINAEATWESARLYLDRVTGTTLEANHVSLSEAKTGQVNQVSSLPPDLPAR
ncbi:MAG TPA: TolC family protein [Bryobacteraceae bacterium]|jgi:outer membrane protein TolC|nr:TolC family protein [Bryobacteraceae bacterium]